MSGFRNGRLEIYPGSVGLYQTVLDGTYTISQYTTSATPESSITANVGSLAIDAANGLMYFKRTGTGNTGWVTISTSATADVVGPASSTDNAVVRFDGTSGKLIQNSVAILTDAGALSGLTQLDVDNLNLNGNTISSTDTNGNIALIPDGTGTVNILTGGTDSLNVTQTVVGGTGQSTFRNDDNTSASSHSQVRIITGGASGGDPYVSFSVEGVTSYAMGIDNSDSDALLIAGTNTLGSSTLFRSTTSGITSLVFQTAGGSGTESSTSMPYYAEGSFTPTFTGQTSAGTTTYSTQQGYYLRVGNLVTICATIVISGATGTGNALIGGLPFTVSNLTNENWRGTIILNDATFAWPASTTVPVLVFVANSTNCRVTCFGNGVGGSALQMSNTSQTITLTGTYRAA